MKQPIELPSQISLHEWDTRYNDLQKKGLVEPSYGGPLRRHFTIGRDLRLQSLCYDNSAASLRLWNFLLTEEERLSKARASGRKLVGVMKDLGTTPVIAYSASNLVAFYPDGAWWIPCVMEMSDGLMHIADRLGIDESFCPVRAMLGAFVNEAHFPRPDMLVCSVGATCDDFSAIAQRLNGLGFPMLWWEIPHRRSSDKSEPVVQLTSDRSLPQTQVQFVMREFQRICRAFGELAGQEISETDLKRSIQHSNKLRSLLAELRHLIFSAPRCPLPALELLIAEMMAIHYCSDANEVILVMEELLETVRHRTRNGLGFLAPDAARLYWVNPVADLRAMNLVERCGGRICGTDNMFTHALDPIPVHLPPLEALACMALSDPMVGTSKERAERICDEMKMWNCEGLVVSRIPGASHCAWETGVIACQVKEKLGLPVLEVEVPPMSDALSASMQSRLEALVETIQAGRDL